mgnify:FL=1
MRRGVLCLPHPGRGSAACPRFSPGAFGVEAVPRVLLAVNFVAEEAVCLGALGQCVQKCFSLDNNPRSMTCRSGVVSVAIVVRTARTTASVLTPEPIALRARTGRSGRAVYTPLRDGQCEGGAPTSRVTAARCRLRARWGGRLVQVLSMWPLRSIAQWLAGRRLCGLCARWGG